MQIYVYIFANKNPQDDSRPATKLESIWSLISLQQRQEQRRVLMEQSV